MNKRRAKKGFTLIELLVVIAIIAILSIVVVLTLNPAEMLRRARDSNRTSDLSIIKTSLSLYLSDVSTTQMGTQGECYLEYSGPTSTPPTTVYEIASATPEATAATVPYPVGGSNLGCVQWMNTNTVGSNESTSRNVDGSGWIPIDLAAISSGAPISQWPADSAFGAGSGCNGPGCNGNAGHFYSYIPGPNNGYKIATKMESVLYSSGGSSDLESTDGGTDPNMYEQGTSLTL